MLVTTGVPIYLVSACGSGEEFVAAFRRYSDRGSLFVPIAEPLPPGRRGRLAVTLADGGVMLEGEAEIVSSSRTASILHGRPGMTIRFVEPDEPTKTLLLELDRARLSVRPGKPSVSARPAEVPATPRPVPPAASGRIDAANALAECVSIGDVATLREGAAPLKPGPKFVMPSIPGAGTKVPTTPPKFNIAPAEPVPIPAPVVPSRPFRLPTPPPEEPADDGQAAQIVNLPPRGLPTTSTQPAAVVPPPRPGKAQSPMVQTIRGTKPAGAGTHRPTTLGMPVVTRPPQPLPPEDPAVADIRSTAVGVGIPPEHDTTTMAATTPPAVVGSLAVDAKAATMPADPILGEGEGDWTMAPDDVAPTPLEPAGPPPGPMTGNWTIALTPDGWGEVEKVGASLPAPGPPTAVSGETGPSVTGEKPLEARRPEPAIVDESKIQIDPTLMEPLPDIEPLEALPDPPSRPTPMPLPPAPSRSTPIPMMAMAEAAAQPYPSAPPQYMQPPSPPPPLNGTGQNAAFHEPRLFEEANASQRMGQAPTAQLAIRRRRRMIVIIASALALAVIGIVIVLAAGGGGGGKEKAKTEVVVPVVEEHAVAPPVAVDAAVVALEPDAAVAEVDAAVAPASGDCAVEIASVPKDVEIAIDNTTKIGTAPGTVQLPCGVEVKLYLRKAGFAGTIKSVTPTADGKPIKVVLARAQFTVKVSSTPAGAAISVGGKPMGVTPTVVHLNGFEPVAVQFTKDGYAPLEQKLTPKQQNQVVHVKLVAKKRLR